MLTTGMALWTLGCATPREDHTLATPVASAEQFPIGTLEINLRSFRTLDELKASSKPHDETEHFFVFEKDQSKVAVVLATWGSGDHWNAVIVYAYDQLRGQWAARALWDTEARNVCVIFDKRKGMIDVRSGGGVLIFRANIAAFVARRTREW